MRHKYWFKRTFFFPQLVLFSFFDWLVLFFFFCDDRKRTCRREPLGCHITCLLFRSIKTMAKTKTFIHSWQTRLETCMRLEARDKSKETKSVIDEIRTRQDEREREREREICLSFIVHRHVSVAWEALDTRLDKRGKTRDETSRGPGKMSNFPWWCILYLSLL